jgi:hypothetical protein
LNLKNIQNSVFIKNSIGKQGFLINQGLFSQGMVEKILEVTLDIRLKNIYKEYLHREIKLMVMKNFFLIQ